MVPQILILGLGYAGTAVANSLATRHHWTVTGTVRGNAPKYPLHPSVGTVDYEQVRCHTQALNVTHVLCTIPPSGGRSSAAETARNILAQNGSIWLGYISTTSVYGDQKGKIVTEVSPLVRNERNEVLIEEEQVWYNELHADVFRCGGIYGPYRNVLDTLISRHKSTKTSRRREKAGTARCHVLDICQVVEKRMQQWNERIENDTNTAEVYNIVDDDNISRRDVEEYVLRQTSLFLDYCSLRGCNSRKLVGRSKSTEELRYLWRKLSRTRKLRTIWESR